MPTLKPDKMVADVTSITLPFLRDKGIKALLLDIDGTLMPTKASQPTSDVFAWIDVMKSGGIKLFILSNSRRGWRVKELGGRIEAPFLHLSRKPFKGGYLKALAALGLPPESAAMVGDQIFTDILGANRCGIYSILVRSTDTDLWYHPLRRLAEKPFMKEGGKG